MEQRQVHGFATAYGSGGDGGDSNANSLQFYTMSKLRQEGEEDRAVSMGGGFSGNNAIINNYNYGASEVGVGGVSNVPNSSYAERDVSVAGGPKVVVPSLPPGLGGGGSSSNVPRKFPFNVGEAGGQLGGGMGAAQGMQLPGCGGFGGAVPLGPMSAPFPQTGGSRMQTGGEFGGPTDPPQQGGRASSFSSLASLARLLSPSLLWSAGQDGSSSDYRGAGHQQVGSEEDFDDILNEPPLLEELGIDPANIAKYLKCVMLFRNIRECAGGRGDGAEDHQVEWDMAGPILLIGCLGFFLLLAGKIHFGYIYGIGILSCIGTYILLNIMSSSQSIDLYTTMSILGYSLLPIVILAGISVVFSLRTKVGIVMAIFFNMWSTTTASRFFEYTVSLKRQRYLIAYPIALLYASFTIVTIF